MTGQAAEHSFGIGEIEKITTTAGHGVVLSQYALRNRDAVYPEVLKGLPDNFFALGTKFKNAQTEFSALAKAIMKQGRIANQA